MKIKSRVAQCCFLMSMALPGVVLAQGPAVPNLTALSFTPSSINTSAGPVNVTVNFTVTDTFTGVLSFQTAFVDPSGVFTQGTTKTLSPPRSPATDSAVITFPQFSAPGAWTLLYVFISDQAGDTLFLDTNGIAAAGFPTALQVTSVQDTVPPNITALSFSPAAINTSAASAVVTVNFTLTDDLSGANSFQAVFTSPSGNQTQTASAGFAAATTVTSSATATFPRFSEAGAWTLTSVFISDAVGNTLALGPADFSTRGFPSTLTVTSASDTTPPTLTAFSFTPASIDVSTAPATVTVNFQATDDLSGVTNIQASFLSPSGATTQTATATFTANTSVTGSATVTFPRTSENGTWTVNSVFLSDAAGNTHNYATADLVGLGFTPTQLSVTNTNPNPTPPTIVPTVNPAPGASGWNSTLPVTVSWSVTDPSGGGIASSTGCGNSTLVAETSGTTFTCSATTNSGGTGSASVTVRIDTRPPTIVPVITPAPNTAGWNNTNVSLSWTVTDPISGVNFDTISGCDPVMLATETPGTTFTCTAVDGAGLSNSVSATIKIDMTPPTATAAASPAPNGAGWNSTNVTVSFTGTDSLSGIASCTAPITLSTEGAGQSASGTCRDVAGNVSAAATASGINIDKTPPVIVPTVSPAPNGAGWNTTSPVTVSWSVTEPSPGSSVTSTTGCTSSTVTAETAGTTFTCTATNIAGLTATVSVTVKLDTTPPVIVPTITPAPNAAGWNNSNTTVTWAVSDSISGIASSSGCAATTVSTETAGTVVTCSATNAAGLTTTTSVTVKLDKSPPVIVPTVNPAPNAAGWNNTSPVTVSWSVTEPSPGSSVTSSSGCTNSTVTAETAGTTFTCTATNIAGLTATVSVTVKLDKTPPVTTATPAPGTLPPGLPLATAHATAVVKNTSGGTVGTITVTCYDTAGLFVGLNAVDNSGGSGVASLTYAATGAQTIASTTVNGASANPSITANGLTTLTFAAKDVAGNQEATKSESVLVGRGDDSFAYACAAPTPTFTIPAHGSASATGTVVINGTTYPFSKTITF